MSTSCVPRCIYFRVARTSIKSTRRHSTQSFRGAVVVSERIGMPSLQTSHPLKRRRSFSSKTLAASSEHIVFSDEVHRGGLTTRCDISVLRTVSAPDFQVARRICDDIGNSRNRYREACIVSSITRRHYLLFLSRRVFLLATSRRIFLYKRMANSAFSAKDICTASSFGFIKRCDEAELEHFIKPLVLWIDADVFVVAILRNFRKTAHDYRMHHPNI